ncbi:MAG TPA: hypothetical protein VLM85_19165 [Polyangiaceae bacterium]|nr:hypothetical protein [Polyangiaceae bacterium]
MKSLIKPKKDQAQQACCAPAQADKVVAQCCAKQSKLVAGCHD